MKNRAAILLSIMILTGCGTRQVYTQLDWLIPWYISDYISLDSDQKNMLEKRLTRLIGGPRAKARLAFGHPPIGRIDQDTLRAYHIKLKALLAGLLAQIGPDIVDMLETASEDQIDELFANLAAKNREFKKKYVDLPVEDSIRNREKRMLKRLRHWISDPNPEQRQAVSAWSSQLTPIAAQWLQNRAKIQAEARRLLAGRDASPFFRPAMLNLIVKPEAMRSAEYQHKIDINTDVTIQFLAALNRMLTDDQRAHLLGRLESLAADFDTLSCDPKTLPKPRF